MQMQIKEQMHVSEDESIEYPVLNKKRSNNLRVLPSGRSAGVSNSESKTGASSSVLGDGSGVDAVVALSRASQPILTLELDVLTLLSNAETSADGIRASGGRVRSSEAQASINGNEDLLATRDNSVEGEGVVAAEELGRSGVGADNAGDVRAVSGRVLEQPELGLCGVDRGVLDLRARVDGDTAKGRGRGRALVEGVLAEAASVLGCTLGLVGGKAVSTTGGSACVVRILASTLASGVVGRALSLVGGKTSDGVRGAAGVVLGHAVGSSGRGSSSGSSGTAGKSGGLAGAPLTDASGVFTKAGGHVAGAHDFRSANGEALVVVDLTLVLRSSNGLCRGGGSRGSEGRKSQSQRGDND